MEKNRKNEVFSSKVRAGKRTYFFDVKQTRSEDFYLTITESKRKQDGESFSYEKHKIFLYKEDLLKFVDALSNTVQFMEDELGIDLEAESYESNVEENTTKTDSIGWDNGY